MGKKRSRDSSPANMGKKRPRDSSPANDRGQKRPRDLEIKALPTSKDEIKQPALAADKNMYIAPLGSSVLICGKSGSGKSTLLANLITDDRFYNGWFDKIFLFSPTANGDDVQRALKIPKKYVFTNLEEAPQLLEVILSSQQSKLDGGNKAHKVDQFAIIFDDVIGDTRFMGDKTFTQCFYQVRHVNCTTFICTQHFKRVPRVCRLQANFIHYFQGSQSEVDTLTEEFAPPNMTKKGFMQLVQKATSKPFSFLTINMKRGWDLRFRENLSTIIPVGKCVTNNTNDDRDGPDEQSGSGEDEGDSSGEGSDWGRDRSGQ